MNDARIIINVSDRDHQHCNGISGTYIVPAKKAKEEFGLLAVYSARELQDVGNQVKTVHWPSSTSVALDIMGSNSDSTAHVLGTVGGAEKWGLLLCEANPDIPRELLTAEEEERVFLTDNRPEIKQKRDQKTKLMLATTVYEPHVAAKLEELAHAVANQRAAFHASCRRMVTKEEVRRAKDAMSIEDARLVSEGDMLWAGNEFSRRNINELHKNACRRLGQERPWCYIPRQLVECPGCASKIREDILTCPACGGWLSEGIEELRRLSPRERAPFMYPERYAKEPEKHQSRA